MENSVKILEFQHFPSPCSRVEPRALGECIDSPLILFQLKGPLFRSDASSSTLKSSPVVSSAAPPSCPQLLVPLCDGNGAIVGL